jgi:hypothetical protein
MTDDKVALRELLEKDSGTTFLREMIGFAANSLLKRPPVACMVEVRWSFGLSERVFGSRFGPGFGVCRPNPDGFWVSCGVCEQPRQADQVVGGHGEGELPIDFG